MLIIIAERSQSQSARYGPKLPCHCLGAYYPDRLRPWGFHGPTSGDSTPGLTPGPCNLSPAMAEGLPTLLRMAVHSAASMADEARKIKEHIMLLSHSTARDCLVQAVHTFAGLLDLVASRAVLIQASVVLGEMALLCPGDPASSGVATARTRRSPPQYGHPRRWRRSWVALWMRLMRWASMLRTWTEW